MTTREAKTIEKLEAELERMKRKTGLGHQVRVVWLPGAEKRHRGKTLKDWVEGDTIQIFAEDPGEALELVRHGFAHWLLNQSNRLHRQLVNKLIEYIEDRMYEHDERIADAITRVLEEDSID